MKTYIYVEARQDGEDVAFRHIEVEAEDASEAYLFGGRRMTAKAGFLNDYVIELTPRLRAVK